MSKRIKQTLTLNNDGTKNLSIVCKKCNKPINTSNQYGMYCEDLCGMEDDIKAFKKIQGMFGNIFK